MSKIELKHIYKNYSKGNNAVTDINLIIDHHEFLVILGPSGSGKSTLLKIIAGLETMTSGELYIDNNLSNSTPPNKRNVAMVFQNSSLFNHMTVQENIAFGQTDSSFPTKEILELAQQLAIDHLLTRYPTELSGGEKQRVCIARALISHPKILLMDEPFSNLDRSLKNQLKQLIKSLHNQLNITFIYVTHDQEEALSMATKIAVLNQGRINQIDSPYNIYHQPSNMFVAGFIGYPSMNFIEATIENHSLIKITDQFTLNLNKPLQESSILLGIRPEEFILESNEQDSILCPIHYIEQIGSDNFIYTQINNTPITIKTTKVIKDNTIHVSLDINKIHLFNKETKEKII